MLTGHAQEVLRGLLGRGPRAVTVQDDLPPRQRLGRDDVLHPDQLRAVPHEVDDESGEGGHVRAQADERHGECEPRDRPESYVVRNSEL